MRKRNVSVWLSVFPSSQIHCGLQDSVEVGIVFVFFFGKAVSIPVFKWKKTTLRLNYSGLGCHLMSAKELTRQIARLLPLLGPSQQGRMRMNKGQLSTVAVEG